MSAYSYIVTF